MASVAGTSWKVMDARLASQHLVARSDVASVRRRRWGSFSPCPPTSGSKRRSPPAYLFPNVIRSRHPFPQLERSRLHDAIPIHSHTQTGGFSKSLYTGALKHTLRIGESSVTLYSLLFSSDSACAIADSLFPPSIRAISSVRTSPLTSARRETVRPFL